MGQQAQSNPDVAPPAPSIPAPQAAQAEQRVVPNQDQAPADRPADSQPGQAERQTFQPQDQANQHQADQRRMDEQGRSALGVTLTDDLRITEVSPGSPAQQMGLRAGDEILSMNGHTFNSVQEFIDAVGATPQDQQVQIEVDRNGQRTTQSGNLAAWDRVHYSGVHSAGRPTQQGLQTHSAMRFPDEGSSMQGAVVQGEYFGDVANCYCDPCAGYGYYGGGYGWDDGLSRREARRAARRGYW